MGPSISQEIQHQFLRTTPIYYRGGKNYPDVRELLVIQISSGKQVHELIQLLRVYLRFERFQTEKSKTAETFANLPIHKIFTNAQLELEMYKSYSARLDGLSLLPFKRHKIQLELCVFHASNWYTSSGDEGLFKYNLFETVRPAYIRAKEAGAHVSVRWEDFTTGACVDVNEHFDLACGEVSTCGSNEHMYVSQLTSRSPSQSLCTSYPPTIPPHHAQP